MLWSGSSFPHSNTTFLFDQATTIAACDTFWLSPVILLQSGRPWILLVLRSAFRRKRVHAKSLRPIRLHLMTVQPRIGPRGP